MDPEIATIQWEMLSNAEFSVAIPLYSALLTEVSPYFSDQDISFDHCEEEDVVNNEEPKNSINYVLMDINTLAYENRDHCATGVRAYLDALQKELIEQNLTVDEAMQAAEDTEARTALANKAGKAATKNTYLKCKAMLEEMRDYLKEEDFSEEFVPSDYDADNDCLVESITYADEALSDEDVAEPEVEEKEVRGQQHGRHGRWRRRHHRCLRLRALSSQEGLRTPTLRRGRDGQGRPPVQPPIRPAGNVAEIFSKKIPCTHFAVL